MSAVFHRGMDPDIERYRGEIIVQRECGSGGGSTEAEGDLDIFGFMAGDAPINLLKYRIQEGAELLSWSGMGFFPYCRTSPPPGLPLPDMCSGNLGNPIVYYSKTVLLDVRGKTLLRNEGRGNDE